MQGKSAVITLLSLLSLLNGVTAQFQSNRGDSKTNGNNGNTGNNDNTGNAGTAGIASTTSAAAAAASSKSVAKAGGATNAGSNNGAQTGLSASVIQSASDLDGSPLADGQSASLTDPQNFVNFCQGKTLTNGQQLTGGSCNSIVMGDIPSKNNMISAIIINPQVGKTIEPNTPFDIAVQVQNLEAGVFTNPDTTYYAAPQQLKGGNVVGHCHVTVQKMQSFTDATPPDASTFAFFKGINDDGNGKGLLKATVTAGLPEGFYRVCTMMGTSNHQPPLMPVAQRGAQEDCTKFQVTAGGNAASGNAASGNAASGNAASGNANTSTGITGNGGAKAKASAVSGTQGGQSDATTSAAAIQSTSAANNGGNGNQMSATTSDSAAQSASADNAQSTSAAKGGKGKQKGATTSAAPDATQTSSANNGAQGGHKGGNKSTATAAAATQTSSTANGAQDGQNGDTSMMGESNGNTNGSAKSAQTNRGDSHGMRYGHKRRAAGGSTVPRFQERDFIV